MRSLFLKLFFWFWLANALGAGAMMLTMWVGLGLRPPEFHETRRDLLRMCGRGAVAILERDGPAAMRAYLQDVDGAPGLRVLLFDEGGSVLTAGSVPDGARDLAMEVVRHGQPDNAAPGPSPLTAARVLDSQGRPYAVVAQRPERPPPLMPEPWFLVMRLFAVVLPGGVICYGLARYLTAPLRRLRAAAQQLARGDLKVRAGARVGNRRDEIGELGKDFDFMAERVESLMSAQRRLLRDMSHELRSPLARLNIAMGLVGKHTDPETRAALDRIEREAERLDELVGGILTLSHMESAEAVERDTVDLSVLVQEIAADAAFEANSRHRDVRVVALEACTVTGSTVLLRSAIENIVRNAVHYTAEGTEVEISLRCAAEGAGAVSLISVRDRGPGVPVEALSEVFRPFYRVADARDRETGGTGLGLAIADRAVRMHGGTVKAANATKGGLVVEVRLPAAEPSDAVPSSTAAKDATQCS